MVSRLADADHRAVGQAARRVKAGIVETGDDEGIGIGVAADQAQKARQAHRLVEIALDRGGAVLGVEGDDLGAGTGGAA